MGCRRHELQEAFFVPGPHAFRVWGYGTADHLADLLMPDYFAPVGGLLQPGELIYVSSRPAGEGPEERRMAVLMVTAAVRGRPQVRMVQNFGTAEDDLPDSEPRTKPAPRTPAKPRAGTRSAAAAGGRSRKRG